MDIIGDMLTSIRNGVRVGKEKVDVPFSKVKIEILKILKAEGYITNYKTMREEKKASIRILLKYKNGKSPITNIKRISKPGLRIYVKKDEIPKVLNGLGIAIISTSKGIMTDYKARALGIGGEVLCYVW